MTNASNDFLPPRDQRNLVPVRRCVLLRANRERATMPNSGLTDIQSIEDVKRFVDLFYSRIQADAILGPIFDQVAKVDWSTHLELMYRFWDSILFGSGTYKGNPLVTHLSVNKKVLHDRQRALDSSDFQHWLNLFHQTVNELFRGPTSDHARQAAVRMATHLTAVCADDYESGPLNVVPQN